MATPNVVAQANGSWSDAANWLSDLGVNRIPQDGDYVYLNGKTIAFDVALAPTTGKLLYLYTGSVATPIGAGNLTINCSSESKTLNCDDQGQGTVTTFNITGSSSSYTFTFSGNVRGGSANLAFGLEVAGGSAVNVIVGGNSLGGTASSNCIGVRTWGAGNVTINGSSTGGTGQYSHGSQHGGSGIFTIKGNCVGSSTVGTSAPGLVYQGSSGTVVVEGTVIGGASGNQGINCITQGTLTLKGITAPGAGVGLNIVTAGSPVVTCTSVTASVGIGIQVARAANITVNGNVVGGSSSGAYGIYALTIASTIVITGAVTGGSNTSCNGINLSVNGCSLTVGGTVTGGSNSTAYGIYIGSYTLTTFTLNGEVIGAVGNGVYYGGTSTLTINNSVTGGANSAVSLANTATVNVTGNVRGGTSSGACGLYLSGGKCTVSGSVTGGSAANAKGIFNMMGAIIAVAGDVIGGSVDATAYGVHNASGYWSFYGGNIVNNTATAFQSETTVRRGIIAKTAGNWNTGSNWYGGSVPTAGQNVVLNGLSMIFDIASTTVADVYGQGSTGQIVFDLNGGNKSFTADNIYAGTHTTGVIRVTGSGYLFTLTCLSITGGSGANAKGISVDSGGSTITVNGNVISGTHGTSSYGIVITSSNNTVSINGNLTANMTAALYSNQAGTINIGSVGNTRSILGSSNNSSTSGIGVLINAGSNIVVANIYANIQGGSGSMTGLVGLYFTSVGGTLNIFGDITAGPVSGNYGLYAGAGSNVTVVGNVYGTGTPTTSTYGILSGITTTGCCKVTGNIIDGLYGNAITGMFRVVPPADGRMYFAYYDYNGGSPLLVKYPVQLAESKVLKGIPHGDRTGQLAYRREKINA